MYAIITILVVSITQVCSNFLEAEVNYQKPKLERNNIVNKGVWVRNKFKENLFEKGRVGDFIFRENSLDVDNLLQNNFDAFGANYMQDSPLVSAYVKRTKRSARFVREQRPRKSIIKNCNGKSCKNKSVSLENKSSMPDIGKTKTNELNPTSVFNDYPYEVAILLNNKSEGEQPKNETPNVVNETETNNPNFNKSSDKVQDSGLAVDAVFKEDNETSKNTSSPKRSMKYDFETEIIKKFEFTEDLNRTEENNEYNDSRVNDRNIFDKDNTVWHQNAPIPDINVYKVVPKEPIPKSKPVTERGLIKVISMLTKTFKKIMKQHTEIKEIHNRISDVNEDFVKTAATITSKFQDFDLKYLYLLKFHEKLKVFDAKLTAKQEYFKTKEREMANNFKEFENQQKKFLQQQRQFYNIQKLMLAQNEKINLKQNLIAKTQSEISHRQNNFARILKKAKQLYSESKYPLITKLSSSLTKLNHNIKDEPKIVHTTSTPLPTTESVKINLFSIPISNKIENQDDMIIKEKDEQTIDDLVYKYYFNNTFIDNLMKNNVLTSFMGTSDNAGHSRNVKSKRNELETTILLPVFESNDSEAFVSKNRERRWINHHSRHKSRRRDRGKGALATIINATDAKLINKNKNNIPIENTVPKEAAKDIKIKNDPFLTMATNFCIEIRQNLNSQMLRWCIEKALRRLQFLDIKNFPTISQDGPTTTPPTKPLNMPSNTKLTTLNTETYTELHTIPNTIKVETLPTTVSTVAVTETTVQTSTKITSPTEMTSKPNTVQISSSQPTLDGVPAFFPGNEELESNLKQYEIKPDIEGNVYYEGSVHASEILDSESQGIDDIIPGLESNSRVDMDPLAFDLQAKRRAFVRKLNEKIKMSLG